MYRESDPKRESPYVKSLVRARAQAMHVACVVMSANANVMEVNSVVKLTQRLNDASCVLHASMVRVSDASHRCEVLHLGNQDGRVHVGSYITSIVIQQEYCCPSQE